jgi:hypothetical protein
VFNLGDSSLTSNLYGASPSIILVADRNNHRIRSITLSGVITTLAGSTSGFVNGLGTSARFNWPPSVALLPTGNAVVADNSNNRVRLVTPTGLTTTLAGNGASSSVDGLGTLASFYSPQGIAASAGGLIAVSEWASCRVRIISATAQVTTLAGAACGSSTDGTGAAAVFGNLYYLAFDLTEGVIVTDNGSNRIRRVSPSGVVTTVAGAAAA